MNDISVFLQWHYRSYIFARVRFSSFLFEGRPLFTASYIPISQLIVISKHICGVPRIEALSDVSHDKFS